ncbi:MFS transporter [Streptomyces sp. NRRL F-5126]|uniref:MFS transporter n=1 Tax=Streptomyces sp. NRRL F-5126 TaxID=1463857 RepID=UPI00056B5D2F|nr:MFS transporter [Streptomyces sp. NRRL F-5126]
MRMRVPGAVRMPRAFGLFYASFAVSMLGDSFRLLAVNVWLFETTSGSIGARLLVVLLATLPGMLLGGVSGVIADRYDKYSVLVVADLIRFAVGLGLAGCAVAGNAAWALALVAVGNGVGVFFSSSSFALLPRLVPEDRLPRANGLMETGQWVVQIAGPSLAAVTLAFGGAAWAFLIDSSTFAVSAVILWILRRKLNHAQVGAAGNADGDGAAGPAEAAGEDGTPDAKPWAAFVDGTRIILRNPPIRSLLFASYGVAFLTACTNYGLIFLIARSLALGPSSLGYIYSLNGAVAVVAALAMTALAKSTHLGRIMALSMLGLCVAQVVMGAAPNIYVLGVGVAVSALSNAPYNVAVSSLYMSRIPAAYLGRVEGIDTMVDNFANVLGFVAASLAVLWWNPRGIFLISALVAAPCVAVAFARVARGSVAPGAPPSGNVEDIEVKV